MSGELSIVCGRVGPVLESVGGECAVRLGRQREVIVSEAHGRYHEPATNGTLYHATIASVAPGTVLSVTPPLLLWNPPSSGINISITGVWLAYISGTLGAGYMAHGAVLGQTGVPTTGTELTPQCGVLTGTRGKARAFSGSTVVSVPVLIRPSFWMTPALATTLVFPQISSDIVEGAIVVPQGVAWAIQGANLGVGTSPLVAMGVTYEEVPVPQ